MTRYRYVFDINDEVSICVWYKWRGIDMYLMYGPMYRYVFDIRAEISICIWYMGQYIDMYLIYGPIYRYVFDIRTDVSICIWYTGRNIDIYLIYGPIYRYAFDIRADISMWISYHESAESGGTQPAQFKYEVQITEWHDILSRVNAFWIFKTRIDWLYPDISGPALFRMPRELV